MAAIVDPKIEIASSAAESTPRTPLHDGSSFQKREDLEEEDYYDIMMVGITGQGKSTTADKMIIASSPHQIITPGARKGDDSEVKSKHKRITVDDLTFWFVGPIPDDLEASFASYLKRLYLSRFIKDPHLDVNEYYEQKEEELIEKEDDTSASTTSCQLISNNVTKIRVLDVPGFYSNSEPNSTPMGISSSLALEKKVNLCTQRHLTVMRSILRIQSTMQTRFRRILYFLPVRGPLQNRRSEVLMQELHLLALYFGRCVFECMVLVATLPSYQKDIPLPEKQLKKTSALFQKALKDVLPHTNEGAVPTPPAIFISMADTCEEIVQKVKSAQVVKDSLELTIHPGICVKCSSLIKWLREERIECIPVDANEDSAIPFGESLCHPIFVPKDGTLKTFEVDNGVPYLVIGRKKKRQLNELVEVCLKCNQAPGTIGCMKVGDLYTVNFKDGKSIDVKVDHTNKIEEHRMLSQSQEKEEDSTQETTAPPATTAQCQERPQHQVQEETGKRQASAQDGGGGVHIRTTAVIEIPGGGGGQRQRSRANGSSSEESSSTDQGSRHRPIGRLGGSSIVAAEESNDGNMSAKIVSGNNLSKVVGSGYWGRVRPQERGDNTSLLEEAGLNEVKGT